MTRAEDAAQSLRDRGYIVTPSGREGRTWTVEMPAGIQLLTLNQRLHWATRARITHDLRLAAFAMARNARIPTLEKARVTVEYQPPKVRRKRDAGNWAPSGKACIDGIRDAGVFADDDSEHLVSEEYWIGEPYPRGRIVLHVTEVA